MSDAIAVVSVVAALGSTASTEAPMLWRRKGSPGAWPSLVLGVGLSPAPRVASAAQWWTRASTCVGSGNSYGHKCWFIW
jgi:hypothetical protein